MSKEIAEKIEKCINSTTLNAPKVGYLLSRMHRYLQNEFYRIIIHFLVNLAHNYRKGEYDGRNEVACREADMLISVLEDKEEQFWNTYNHMYVD